MTVPMTSPAAVDAVRAALASAGYRPVPVKSASKVPVGQAWQMKARAGEVPKANGWTLNTGILTDGLRAIDVDVDDPDLAQRAFDITVATLGQAPVRGRADSPRRLLIYRAADGEPGKRTLKGPKGRNVEVLGVGQQFVAYGRHPEGADYEWQSDDLATTPVDDLPRIGEDQIDELFAKLGPVLGIEDQSEARPAPKAIIPVAPRPAGGDFYVNVNRRAMESLSLWVPTIFGAAARPSANGGYRVASKDLGRDLEEDLSIAPNGIVDFGTADMGDPQQGKRTPIDLAIEYGRGPDAKAAAFWLCGQLGVSPDAMGWDRSDILPDDGYDASSLRVGGERFDPETGEQLEDGAVEIEETEGDDAEQLGGAVDYFDAPDAILQPTGLVGALADWICEWASEPVRIHAVGAALVIVGTLIGRKVFSKSKPVGTALYVGALTPSGVGKQHPVDCIKLALTEASGARQTYLGWNTSAASLLYEMQRRACRAMLPDEFADKLVSLRSRNASTNQAALSEALRSLWGSTHSSYSPDVSISSTERGVGEIARPNLSIFGTSPLRDFERALVSKDVVNGMFNRFLILPRYAPVASQPERDEVLTLPDDIRQRLQSMWNCIPSLGDIGGDNPPQNPIHVPFTDDALQLHEDNRAFGKRMQVASERDDTLALYGRYAEQIKRIALIVACGRRPTDLQSAEVESSDMGFARGLVDYSVAQFVLMVRREMVENETQAHRKMVVEIIRKAGREGISRSLLTKKIKGRLIGRAYTDTLQALVDAGDVRVIAEGRATRGPQGQRFFIHGSA